LSGIDNGFLSKLETGRANGSWETYTKIAGALGISVERLFVSSSNVEAAPLDWREIPILDYRQAGSWTIDSSASDLAEHDTIMTALELPPSTFALRLLGNSMEPRFLEGDIVVVDPTTPPGPGDFVVAAEGNGDTTFRQYRNAGLNEAGMDVFELVPLNPLYAPMRSDRVALAIVGTMVEHRSFRRRG
jgi:SOS-response transcriptional repressor LexA